jgi:hypothetical protein
MERRDDSLEVRVSDSERERVVELLKSHLADGRLTVEEFSDRAAEAYSAKTVGDLQWVLRELPQDPRSVADEKREARRTWLRHSVTKFAMPNVICVGVWAASGGGAFWPAWVLFATGIGFTRRLLRGPGQPDSDERPALKDGSVLTTCLFIEVRRACDLHSR